MAAASSCKFCSCAETLGKIAGETGSGQPRTFFRPFSMMIHSLEEMREELHTLERKRERESNLLRCPVEDTEPPLKVLDNLAVDASISENTNKEYEDSNGSAYPESKLIASLADEEVCPEQVNISRTGTLLSDLAVKSADPEEQKSDLVMNSKEALQDLRRYVKFVDEKLMPLYQQFDVPENINSYKIRFDDL